MASEYYYPDWIEKALNKGWFKFNPETNIYKYNNPTNNHKNKYEFKINANKGDLIRFTPKAINEKLYRNEGVWIYDGKNIHPLYTEIDDYGSVPPNFKVGKDFHPNHWKDKIVHNDIIWLEDDIINNIIIKENLNKKIKGNVKIFEKLYKVNIECDCLIDDTIMYSNSTTYESGLKSILKTSQLFIENNEIKLIKNHNNELHEKLYKIEPVDKSIKDKLIEWIQNNELYIEHEWLITEQEDILFIKHDNVKHLINISYLRKDNETLIKLLREKIISEKPCFHIVDENTLEVYI